MYYKDDFCGCDKKEKYEDEKIICKCKKEEECKPQSKPICKPFTECKPVCKPSCECKEVCKKVCKPVCKPACECKTVYKPFCEAPKKEEKFECECKQEKKDYCDLKDKYDMVNSYFYEADLCDKK